MAENLGSRNGWTEKVVTGGAWVRQTSFYDSIRGVQNVVKHSAQPDPSLIFCGLSHHPRPEITAAT